MDPALAGFFWHVVKSAKQLMRDFGIDVAELGGRRAAKRLAGQQPAKYRDPASGHGKAPAWIAGKDRSAFEI
ncbi:H-NS histone family protein [Burkholderia gladioli]|uniref:Histone family protein nucleoid-structuring protein H-NS n=1 Tax=Burkholderia gladioli (strain BSR3) TaxID=999541 RepID=F2LTE7_BURGS|nr:H-NS histone family protein [Burkholderia gladioli]AEA66093.1 histone family protein nucleoid-structuring protein H-NS [Burkholderia gladioli BSR3]